MFRRLGWSAAYLLLASLVTATASAASPDEAYPDNVETSLGTRNVILPIPAGFGPPDQTPAKVSGLLRRNLPESQHFLGVLMDTRDLAAFNRGAIPRMERYFMLTSSTAAEARGISPTKFANFQASIRQTGRDALDREFQAQASNLENMAKELREASGKPDLTMDVKISEALGVFVDNKDAIALATSASVSTSANSALGRQPMFMATGFARLHGRLVILSAYARANSRSDLDWAEGQVRGWLGRAAELNPPDAQDMAAPPDRVEATIGGHMLVLPVPAGYIEPAETPVAANKDIEAHLPAANRLVAVMLQDTSSMANPSGSDADPGGRYMLVQTLRDIERLGIDAKTFDLLKAAMRSQSAQLGTQSAKDIGAGAAKPVKDVGKAAGDDPSAFQVSHPASLGVFEDRRDSISLALQRDTSVQTSARTGSGRELITLCVIHVGNQVLIGSFVTGYRSADDVEWAKTQTREWARRVRELNP